VPGDLFLSRFVQELPVPGGVVGALLSNADRAVWLILATALTVTLLLRSWLSALFIFLASFTSVLLGVALKLIVARPRPSAELVQVYDTSQSYSFPSITAFFSVVLLGVVVHLIWRRQPLRPTLAIALVGSLVLVLVMGLSRVYVGEHWPSDVLGGWLFGAAGLLTLMKIRWAAIRGRV
jgi:undecaprenyl-diphosphatase